MVKLGREAAKKGYRPNDRTEYLPFLEGYLQSGLWDDAFELSKNIFQYAPDTRLALCSAWKRGVQSYHPGDRGLELFNQMNVSLRCP